MLVPAPAACQEFGVGGMPGGAAGLDCGAHAFAAGVEGAGCGPQWLAGVAGAADAGDALNAFPLVALAHGSKFAAHGSKFGGALNGDPILL